MITREQINRFVPGANPELVEAIINNWGAAIAAGIEREDHPNRLHHFMASIAVETGGLKRVSENLNYTSAERVYAIFKGPSKNRRFRSVAECEPYVRQPKKLAIKVYGGRLGNAPAPSEDGWIYRGAGMMQTTGRANFRALGFENNPEELRDPDTAFSTAVSEWMRRGCNAISDQGNLRAVRKAINGGTNGLTDFEVYVAKARVVWPTVDGVLSSIDQVADELDREYGREEPPVPLPREDRPARTYADYVTVANVQAKLWDLGYTEVGSRRPDGNFDGDLGSLTKAAILAFRNDNKLPLTDKIDDELLAALQTAPPRNLPRTDATPAEVRETVPEVKSNWFTKLWAWMLGGGAAAGAGVTGAGEADPDQNGIFRTLLAYVRDVPPWMWFVLIAIVAVAIWYYSNRTEKHAVAAFKAGARR
jgi:predicted chitinase